MSTPSTPHFGSTAIAQTATTLHKALSQIGDLQLACWSAEAFVRTVSPQDLQDRDDMLQSLIEVDEACQQLKKRVQHLARMWSHAHDQAALKGMAGKTG